MNLPVDASSFRNVEKPIIRKSANYHPTIWGDYFIDYASKITKKKSIEEEQKHNVLRDEIRDILVGAPSKSLEKLNLMNDIQRLGICYHFEDEIDISLNKMYNEYDECVVEDANDLHRTALRFRLLRQQGHFVSCDVFNKFKDKSGRFNESLVSDIHGMLSLYEAAHLSAHDEYILDEAFKFTSNKLELMIPKISKNLAAKVVKALEIPIHLTLTRVGAREYLSFYQEDDSHHQTLLDFAKLDFNMVQKLHQKELGEISRWWKSLDVPTNFPFARDRIAECYLWIIGVYFEPKYSLPRMFLTKVISLSSIMDDIYDVYGTVDELQLLTDAIQRWDTSATSDVPPALKLFYTSLLDILDEMEEKMIKEGAPYSILYAKNEMKKLSLAFMQEAIWCKERYVPRFEEYMKVAKVTAGYMLLGTSSFVGMGDIATQQAFEWVTNEPPIIIAVSTVCRLQDDKVTHEHEQKREHVASGYDCYMKHYGFSKQEISAEFDKRISNAWKDVNAAFLHPTNVASPLLLRIQNLARAINIFHKDNDHYSNSKTKMRNWVSMVLVNPV